MALLPEIFTPALKPAIQLFQPVLGGLYVGGKQGSGVACFLLLDKLTEPDVLAFDEFIETNFDMPLDDLCFLLTLTRYFIKKGSKGLFHNRLLNLVAQWQVFLVRRRCVLGCRRQIQ